MQTAQGLMNTTYRNTSGQLGDDFSVLYAQLPPFPEFSPPSPSTTPSYQTPTYSTPPTFSSGNGGGSQTSLPLSNIFNSSVGLASQLITAFGKNASQQITGSKTVQALVAPQTQQNPYGTGGLTVAQQQQLQAAQQAALAAQQAGLGASALNAGTGILDSLAKSFNVSTTALLLFGIGGALLLFRKPPTRR